MIPCPWHTIAFASCSSPIVSPWISCYTTTNMSKLWPFKKNTPSPRSPPSSGPPTPAHEGSDRALTHVQAGAGSTIGGSNSAYDDISAHYSHSPGASTRMLRRQISYNTNADERSRLLGPGRSARFGPLDPDDPAVSPYNLWTVGPTFLFIVGLYITLCC